MGRSLASKVSVLVPFRPGDAARDLLWRWVKGQWRARFPDFELIWASDTGSGPWRKGIAVQRAAEAATRPICVVTDADVWIPDIPRAILAVWGGQTWARGHNAVHRLTWEATEAVLSGDFVELVGEYPENLCEPPYAQEAAGAGTVIRREALLDVPIDPRFAGWGGEDLAWAYALETLFGPTTRANGPCYHLWHPPAQRIAERIGSEASNSLRINYLRATKDPERLKTLLEGAKAAYYDFTEPVIR